MSKAYRYAVGLALANDSLEKNLNYVGGRHQNLGGYLRKGYMEKWF